MATDTGRTKFEHAEPILRVSDMNSSVLYYTQVLGFVNAEWGSDEFTVVSRDGASIYLCRGSQGCRGRGRGSGWRTWTPFIESICSREPACDSRPTISVGSGNPC